MIAGRDRSDVFLGEKKRKNNLRTHYNTVMLNTKFSPQANFCKVHLLGIKFFSIMCVFPVLFTYLEPPNNRILELKEFLNPWIISILVQMRQLRPKKIL